MADIATGAGTVMVLTPEESIALGLLLQDWMDDTYRKGTECGDSETVESYERTRSVLHEVLEAFGADVDPSYMFVKDGE